MFAINAAHFLLRSLKDTALSKNAKGKSYS